MNKEPITKNGLEKLKKELENLKILNGQKWYKLYLKQDHTVT